jgi:hypothetical protein
MVDGGIAKFRKENALLSQLFVMDGKTPVAEVVPNAGKDVGATITLKGFVRFQLGEGIEKEESDFAAEVAAPRWRRKLSKRAIAALFRRAGSPLGNGALARSRVRAIRLSDIDYTPPKVPPPPSWHLPGMKRILAETVGRGADGTARVAFGIDPETVASMAAEVKEAKERGHEICLVIGGGNIFRGMAACRQGYGPRAGRLYGHARDGDERARDAECA